MNVRLVAVSGPLRGSAFCVDPGRFTIGRDPSSSLSIDDPAVSRHHCVLVSDSEALQLCDLDSRNGTAVEGKRVKDAVLHGGERITVGASTFVIAVEREGAVVEEGSRQPTGTVLLKPDDSVYLHPERLDRTRTAERRFAALLALAARLASLRDAEGLEQHLLECMPGLVPADAVALRPLDTAAPADAAEQRAVSECAAVLHESSVLALPLTVRGEAVALLRLESHAGAFDNEHLEAAGGIASLVSLALDRLRYVERLEAEGRIQQRAGVIAVSGPMRSTVDMVLRVAPSDATVLILGESGSGKEVLARAVHENSRRASGPFLAVNCAALNENLLESELFGHEKGAFTGAVVQKRGRIELAAGGTLFLDEIGELASALQAKLLRVLQQREYERVGGVRTLHADVRVVAATNRDLDAAVRLGSFRQDLFYRLNVIAVRVPPLRERREDVLPLATHFAARLSERAGRTPPSFSPAARACLLRYDWPGNVRELENTVERAIVLGAGDWIAPEDLPDAVIDAGPAPAAEGFHEAVREAKRRILLGAIEQANGSHAGAARSLGLTPAYLSRLLRNLGL